MKKYITIIITILSTLHLSSQHGVVTTTSSCDEDNNGTIHIVLDYPSGLSGYGNFGPPHNVEYYNTTIDGAYYLTTNDKEFLMVEMAPGEYDITVSLSNTVDLNLCAIIERTVDIKIQDIIPGCADGDGYVEILVSGGTPPYTYRWSNGETEEDLSEVGPGSYTITVTDADDCKSIESVVVPDRLPELVYGIEHNCTQGDEQGRILIYTQEGYTYEWQSTIGQTIEFPGYSIKSNLPNGQICINVIDDNTSCTKEHCFYIDSEDEIKVCCIEEKDPCVSIPDGEISFDFYDPNELYSGNSLFPTPNITWSDGTEYSGLKSREQLGPGVYTATITTQCYSKVLTFDLDYDCECPAFKEVELAMLWACSPSGDEGAAVVLSPEYPEISFPFLQNPYVRYEWSGDHPVTVHPWRKNRVAVLKTGSYGVTITDKISGCQTTKDFTIGIETPIRLSHQEIQASCPLDGTGSIDFNYYGGTKNYNSNMPYTVIWEDLPGLHPDQGDFYRNNLLPGEYCVRVRSNCYEEVFCFDVPAIGIRAHFTPTYSTEGCESNSLRGEASGDNPPYTYLWNNGGEGDEIKKIPLGLYKVTVTDAEGCTAEFTHELYPITIVSQTNACPGLEDGSIVIRIENPSNYPTTVFVEYGTPCIDCFTSFLYPIVVDDVSNPVEFEVNQLRGDIEYVLVITQVLPNGKECSYRFSFEIDEDDYNREFVRAEPLDDEGYAYDCIYHIECKGDILLEGLHELSSYVANEPCERYDQSGNGARLWNGFRNSIDCGSVEIFCGDEKVNSIEMESVKARAGEYRQLIQDMYGYDVFPDGQDSEYGNPCRRMAYCPQDPQNCYSMSWGGNAGGGSYQGYEDVDEDGCVKVKCKIFGFGVHDYKICGVDYVPDFLRSYIITNNRFGFNINFSDTLDARSCNEVENNARQLWENDAELIEEYGEVYENSELRKFLLEIQPSNQFNSVDPINCTQIRYCTNDFSITWDNFDLVDCFEIDQELYEEIGENYSFGWDGPCHGVNGVENGIPGIWILCADPDCAEPISPEYPCLRPRFVSSLYSDLNFKCESGPTHTQYVIRQKQNTEFKSFSLLQDSYGNTYTNGIYNSIDKTYYHYIQEEKYKLKLSTTVLHAYEFPEGDYSFYVLQDSMIAEAVTFLTGNPDDFQEQSIQASDSLFIEKFSRISDELFVVKASYEGELKYNSDVISTANGRNQIVMHIDNFGQLIDHSIVSTASDSYNESLKSGTDNLIYQTTYNNQIININGNNQSGGAKGSIIESSILNGVAVTETNLRLTGDLSLEAYSSEKSGKDKYYVIKGNTGGIYYKNSQVKNVQGLSSYILKVEGTKVSWINEIEVENIYDFVPNIEVDANDNIYVGMNTFSGANENFPTRGLGGVDITILAFGKGGTVVKDYFYTSSSTEILVDIHLTNNILFLGGTMSGNADQRTIGELRYYNFSGRQKHGFTSFIYLDPNDNFEDKGCDDICDVDILFEFENCEITYSIFGSYANDYFLTVQSPSGQITKIGYRQEGAYTFDYFTEVGEYKFYFESTNFICDDIIHSVFISDGCLNSNGICNSINNSASGTDNWNGSYISDGDGVLSIYFDTYNIPDQLKIYQNTVLIFDSYAYSSDWNQSQVDNFFPTCGAVGGDQAIYYDVDIKENDFIELSIIADNCMHGNTVWNLDAICSANSQSQTLELRHQNDTNLEKELITEKVEQELFDFDFYPNPTNGLVWLDMPFNCDYSVALFSTFNIELERWKLSGSNMDLNLSKFDSGVYLLSVHCGQNVVTKKIVILE